MAWLQRRTKFRRISIDRFRSLPGRPSRSLGPPGKRAIRYVITGLFLLIAVAILTVRPAGPQLKLNDISPRAYRARVTFKVYDQEATRRALDAVQARCPRVYRESREQLDRIPQELERFLLLVVDARRLKDLPAGARIKWGVNEETTELLKAELDRAWIEQAIPLVQLKLQHAAECGIMDASARQQEFASERYEVVVKNDTPSPSIDARRDVAITFEYPTGLQEYLSDEIKVVLREKSAQFQKVFLDMLRHSVTPTLKRDEVATRNAIAEAREQTGGIYRTIVKDSFILQAGDLITRSVLDEIAAENAEFRRIGGSMLDAKTIRRMLASGIGVTALFFAGFFVLMSRARQVSGDVINSNRRIALFYLIFLVSFITVRLLEYFGFSLQWMPLILTAMIFTLTMGPLISFGGVVLIALMAGIITDGGVSLIVPLLLGSAVAVARMVRLRRRTHVFETALFAGLVQAAAVWALWAARIIQAPADSPMQVEPLIDSLSAIGGGVLAGAILTAALPYVEKAFDVATDLRLLEWTDQNQPLLRKLALEAPGTYHHSTIVSNLAEIAAESIGANALLARAGGYLHDVGKIARPEYFVENCNGQPSRHEQLSPMLSTLVLTAHPKDGAELAVQYGVPSPIRRIIAEHHGCSLVEYFYGMALEAARKKGAAGDKAVGVPVDEHSFRYHSPRPRSPESAIVMLADSVESAARSLDNPSPARLQQLVHTIVERRLQDGQLDECRMNITDIRQVEKSLVRSLTAVSHPRIRYPAIRDVARPPSTEVK